ncbi:MAG: potassium-transporting ATPase subunit C, partial [Pseudoflavonifractor sp.]
MKFLTELKKPLKVMLVLLLLCGLLYPLLLTGISQVIFPRQANGRAVGSALVGQDFTDPRFLRGRPSAVGYNTYAAGDDFAGISSGAQNYAPSNPALTRRVQADMDGFLAAHPGLTAADIPADLVTASGSGL